MHNIFHNKGDFFNVKRKKGTIHVDRHRGRLRGRVPELHPHCTLSYFYEGITSRFPLANHFDSRGSGSIFGIFQDPHMCVHASLSQDGY